MNTRHNPMLNLPAVRRLFTEAPPEVLSWLEAICRDLACQARQRGDDYWSRNKAMQAAYFRVVSTYSRHLGRACRKAKQDQASQVRQAG